MEELRQLAADLAKGLDVTKVVPVLQSSGKAIESQMRAEAGGSRHFGKMAGHITAEMRQTFAGPEVEVGPEKRGAGNLGAIAYFGGSHGGGGTVEDPRGALDAEAPNFERALADLAEDVL